MPKFCLTSNSIEFDGKTLYQIIALTDFSNVKAGDLGGYVEFESNLSQSGNCWLYNNSKCYGAEAHISDNATLHDNSIFYTTNKFRWLLCDNAALYNNSKVCDCDLGGNTKIYNNAELTKCTFYRDSKVTIRGNCKLTSVTCKSKLVCCDNSTICNCSFSKCRTKVYGNSALFRITCQCNVTFRNCELSDNWYEKSTYPDGVTFVNGEVVKTVKPKSNPPKAKTKRLTTVAILEPSYTPLTSQFPCETTITGYIS